MRVLILIGLSCAMYIAITFATSPMVDQYKEVVSNAKAESTCVAKLISEGTERINIKTENGTCTVEKNGYYH